jgi:hypothetical protein
MADKKLVASVENIESRIFIIRGQKVMLDADLAELYGVETKRLNEQVRRNIGRFPEDFMFQLTAEEFVNLKSQSATSSWGGRRKLPSAFTEHGAIIAASVLNSASAIEISVHVVRAFVHLRELVSPHKELWIKQLAIRLGCKRPQPSRWLSQKLNQLERKVGAHDRAIAELINAIRQLMTPLDPKKKRPTGFAPWKKMNQHATRSDLAVSSHGAVPSALRTPDSSRSHPQFRAPFRRGVARRFADLAHQADAPAWPACPSAVALCRYLPPAP